MTDNHTVSRGLRGPLSPTTNEVDISTVPPSRGSAGDVGRVERFPSEREIQENEIAYLKAVMKSLVLRLGGRAIISDTTLNISTNYLLVFSRDDENRRTIITAE